MKSSEHVYGLIKDIMFQYSYNLNKRSKIIPDDGSTLFICSGMQDFKKRFINADGSKKATCQTCIRTNDIELVGDGIHFTSFSMIGNFSFGTTTFEESVSMWSDILLNLNIYNPIIHIHPEALEHNRMWSSRGYEIVFDKSCEWTDGNIGGKCCEIFKDGIELGNLVNILGNSTDVGFGLERLVAAYNGGVPVDQIDMFDQRMSKIARDHIRTLCIFFENKILPGAKGRNSICRKLIRRIIDDPTIIIPEILRPWFSAERILLDKRLSILNSKFDKYKNKSYEWWFETYGIEKNELIDFSNEAKLKRG